MLLVTCVCALIAVLMIAVIGLWHRRARGPEGMAREKALYAGFVADVERRLGRGDIDESTAREERAEAGRALLRASEAGVAATAIRPVWLLTTVIVVGCLTFGLYLFVGHPSLPDQPYKKRVEQWSHIAASDPASLPFDAVVAVLRQDIDKPGNGPDYWDALGRAEMLAGDTYEGLKAYRRELAMTGPAAFANWSELGEAMTLRAGTATAESNQAFAMALQRDPHDTRAHYYLGQAAVADGRYDEARTQFKAALADVPAGDVRYNQIEAALQGVDPAEKAGNAARARISAMVAAMAASLKANPDNPDGWARLLRSYDVLGDMAEHDAAVKTVQAHFPADQAAAILARSKAAVGAEDTGGQP